MRDKGDPGSRCHCHLCAYDSDAVFINLINIFVAQSLRPVRITSCFGGFLDFRSSTILASLDTKTITSLNKLQKPHIFAPLGNEPYFESKGIPKSNTHCLDWWDSRTITVALPCSSSSEEKITGVFSLTCTPAQHTTGRGIHDHCKSLWASWAVEAKTTPNLQTGPRVKIWFAGDTGYRAVKRGQNEDEVPYCPAFEEIGEKFGGFDLALIPIG